MWGCDALREGRGCDLSVGEEWDIETRMLESDP